MELLEKTLAEIDGLDEEMEKRAQKRLNSLTKPPGSLGRLEDLAVKLAGITGEEKPQIKNRVHILMAADHGVTEEGVSAVPSLVTLKMVENFLEGGAAINVFCRQAGVELKVVDMGMNRPLEHEDLIQRRVRDGTDNICRSPAMEREEAVEAVEAGIELALSEVERGADLLSTGEMGIGNTTPSSAILAAMTSHSVEEVVGYGSGISEEQLEHKKEVVARAIETNNPDAQDAVDVLASVGGLEIAGMAGVMIGGASASVPVMIDGFISGAAALIADGLKQEVSKYLIPSHKSVEPGHIKIYDKLDLKPMLDLDMRLGEGTGAVLNVHQVEAACRIISEMATFAEAGIEMG